MDVFEFYRFVFPEGSLQKDKAKDRKYNAIMHELRLNSETNRTSGTNYIIHDDLKGLERAQISDNFMIMAPVAFAGRRSTSVLARQLYGIGIDVDDIVIEKETDPAGLWFYLRNCYGGGFPQPSAIACSGSGLHFYYLFEEPIPLHKEIKEELDLIKRILIEWIWRKEITTSYKNPQYEALTQGFRMPESICKDGITRVKVFQTGRKFDLNELKAFIPDFRLPKVAKTKVIKDENHLTREKAKELYPNWYENRIVQGKKKGTYTVNVALYNWWKEQTRKNITKGHRYWSIFALSIYARKCGISRETLEKDAYELTDYLEKECHNPEDPFTYSDAEDAMKAFDDISVRFTAQALSRLTAVEFPNNHRKGRKQVEHLKRARYSQELDYPDGSWRKGNGRPSKESIVKEFRKRHPAKSKLECKEQTGLTYPTIRKYWDN